MENAEKAINAWGLTCTGVPGDKDGRSDEDRMGNKKHRIGIQCYPRMHGEQKDRKG